MRREYFDVMHIVRHADGTLVRMDCKQPYVVRVAYPTDLITKLCEEDCDEDCEDWLYNLPRANDATGRYYFRED